MPPHMSPNQLAMLEEISLNLAPGEVTVSRSEPPSPPGFELATKQGTRLFYPVSEPEVGEKDACLQYLFRYKFAQFDPAYLPQLRATSPAGYRSILGVRHEHAFQAFGRNNAALLAEKFALRPGDQIFEGGAYIGFSTVRMGQRIGTSGKILACEPIPANFAVLQRNIANNDIHAIPLQVAVGGADNLAGTIYRTRHQANSIIPHVVNHTSEQATPIKTIATLCQERAFSPSFIILTINGAELDAVLGSLDFLASLRSARIIAVGMYADSEGIIAPRLEKALQNIGYTVFCGKTCYAFKD